MAIRLECLVIDAVNPSTLARFWADALGWPVTYEEPDQVVVELDGEPFIPLVFVPVPDPTQGQNRIHLDLTSISPEHQAEQVSRLETRGATPVDIGQGDVPWVVLADPEGNEFCVLDPRAVYGDTGPVGSVVMRCVDPAALAPFWSAATGWPVADTGDDWVSLRRPGGRGPFVELLAAADPKTVKNRLHIDVAPYEDDDHAAEVTRLEDTGARRIDIGQGDQSWVVMSDPEGNEFCVLSPHGMPS
ncbi:MAG: VOC family protein [Acidimicrobiales bacterium]